MNDFLYMNFIFLLQEINYGYFLVYFLHSKHKIKDFLLILFGFHFIFNPVATIRKLMSHLNEDGIQCISVPDIIYNNPKNVESYCQIMILIVINQSSH